MEPIGWFVLCSILFFAAFIYAYRMGMNHAYENTVEALLEELEKNDIVKFTKDEDGNLHVFAGDNTGE